MKYIITALDAEARVFIEHYSLKRNFDLPYTLYKNDDMILLVCGMGKMSALMATSALLGYRIPKKEDILLNIGICGAPNEFSIGEALIIHQILDNGRNYYPDILFSHALRETSLLCVNAPQSEPTEFPVDMESAGVFLAASKFFKLHQMVFLKIVSDHFTPEKITKEGTIDLIRSHLNTISDLLSSVEAIVPALAIFTEDEHNCIEAFKQHFTKSQGDALEDALCYFRLKNPNDAIQLPYALPNSKRERSTLLETYIATLTA